MPFGETSLVVTAFTQAHGLQSYMVKGARGTGKKGRSFRPFLQPGALLSLVVYHHHSDQLQYIREMSWAHVYRQVLTNVVHNAVAVFMIELLTKCIRHSEPNPDLYAETESYFLLLDSADPAVVANLPLHFALWLAGELGFRPENNFSEEYCLFDLKEGKFVPATAQSGRLMGANASRITNQLLSVAHPVTLYRVKLSREQRHDLLRDFETYFSIHIEGFGHMRSLEVLGAVFS